jgi:uncharacterized membrane protein YhaH (DUF805 family)
MEDLFEFMFGASGRINRATYWRSLVVFGIAGLFAGIILLTTASLAASLFIVTVAVIFLPWLIWGFAIHTERLHDRNKNAWWLVAFYLVPGMLGHFAKTTWFVVATGAALQCILALAASTMSIWGFVEIGCLPGTAGPNRYGPNPLARPTGGAARPGFQHPVNERGG